MNHDDKTEINELFYDYQQYHWYSPFRGTSVSHCFPIIGQIIGVIIQIITHTAVRKGECWSLALALATLSEGNEKSMGKHAVIFHPCRWIKILPAIWNMLNVETWQKYIVRAVSESLGPLMDGWKKKTRENAVVHLVAVSFRGHDWFNWTHLSFKAFQWI